GRLEGRELHRSLDAVGAVAERAVIYAGGVARDARHAQARAPAEPAARVAVEVEADTVTVEVRADLDALLSREVAADQIAQLLVAARQADPLVRLKAGAEHHRGVIVRHRGRDLRGVEIAGLRGVAAGVENGLVRERSEERRVGKAGV